MKKWAVTFQFNSLPSKIARQSATVEASNIGLAVKRAFVSVKGNIKGRRITDALIGAMRVKEVKNGGDT